MNKAFIYTLSDPRNGLVRYIGKTNDPDMRLKAHLNSSRDKNTHKRNWINNIKKEGMKPDFDIVDEVPIDEWQYWEKFYISLFKCWGFDLLNYTSGGDGATFANKGTWKKGNVPHNRGIPHSEEVKNKIREKLNVIDGYLYFSKNVIADFVKIAYWGLNVDNKGSLMIPAGASIACEAYACWNWCLTNFTTHKPIKGTKAEFTTSAQLLANRCYRQYGQI